MGVALEGEYGGAGGGGDNNTNTNGGGGNNGKSEGVIGVGGGAVGDMEFRVRAVAVFEVSLPSGLSSPSFDGHYLMIVYRTS